ncbi:hypothetical protein SLE2022_120000 [Rubroshorea leprosula]
MEDCSWIDCRVDDDGFVIDEFKEKVQFFVRFAFSKPKAKSEIKYPCLKCKCRKWGNLEVIFVHLCKHGFMNNYYTWYVHGETSNNLARNFGGESFNTEFVRNEADAMYREMVVDAMGPQLWLKELRFPDGYASNIARCVNMHDLHLFGIKSHDCHVFMQRLLPIAFRDLFIDEVWGLPTKISNFFRALSTPVIEVSNLEMWEEKFFETSCELKKVFPPAFFDSMEHLVIHLPYEAKVGEPVQCCWMYLFERLNRHPRNIVGGNDDNGGCLSIFKNRGQPLSGEMRRRTLSLKELKAARLYVLLNCEEVEP